MFIFPYKAESSSAKALANALGAKRILLENSKFKGSPSKIVINWGNSMTNEEIEKASVLNTPEAVTRASNKLTFFETVQGQVPIPEFTRRRDDARPWLNEQGIVVVRENLNGHSGQGIVLLEDAQTFDAYNHVRARLYTRYIPKKHEFRLHVVGGVVVDIQQKRKRADVPNELVNYKIRNHQTGFIYARENVELPHPQMAEDAIKSVALCGLHFGAVDMLWNDYRKTGFVLEVNTAPGLEGQTVDNYAIAFATVTEAQPAGGHIPIDWAAVAERARNNLRLDNAVRVNPRPRVAGRDDREARIERVEQAAAQVNGRLGDWIDRAWIDDPVLPEAPNRA